MRSIVGFVATSLLAMVSTTVAQQAPSNETVRSAVVTPITEQLVLDGILEEAVWQTAPKIGNLIQREPRQGEDPSEQTEVMLLRDADNLYIGVICYDAEPHLIIATHIARDATLVYND